LKNISNFPKLPLDKFSVIAYYRYIRFSDNAKRNLEKGFDYVYINQKRQRRSSQKNAVLIEALRNGSRAIENEIDCLYDNGGAVAKLHAKTAIINQEIHRLLAEIEDPEVNKRLIEEDELLGPDEGLLFA